MLDHDGDIPAFGVCIGGKVQDVTVTHQRVFAPDTRVVDDRGYNDNRLYAEWTESRCFPSGPQHRRILKDQVIRLTV